ncbi:MAG: tetratricopeptide repeat protein [Candidatus Yanofskybacteria bacterium]|nr:tetratricopeptide repeat protein [Candidatus Yanofskybacteria bacterium]
MISSRQKKEIVAVFLASIILSFFLFGNVISGKFVGDDNAVVNSRTDLRSLKNIPDFFTSSAYPGQASVGLYRPLTLFSYAFNFTFSEKPAGFHILNILIHALNVVLVFLITCKFTSKKIAYFSSLLFLFLPIHTEAVSSIVGRSELLSVFFILLALLLFLKNRHIWASLVFLFALLSKEFAVILLPLIGLLLLFEAVETKKLKKFIRIGLFYLPPPAIYFFLRYLVLGKYAFGGIIFDHVTAPLAFLSLKERIFSGFFSFFLYLRKSFYPVDLSPDYYFNQIPAVQNIFYSPQAIAGLILFLGFVAMIVFGHKNLKVAASILLVPFIFISNMFFLTSGSFAERWWYLPSFGLAVVVMIFIDWVIGKYKRLKPVFIIFSLFLTGWFSFVIIKQNRIWFSNESLFVYAAKVSSNSAFARSNLAAVYLGKKDFDKAKEEVEAALRIYNAHMPALNILGKLYWRDGRYEEAGAAFEKAIEADVRDSNSRGFYRTLAFLNLDLGNNREAFAYMKKAIEFPAAGGSEKIIKTDEILYQVLEDFKDRKVGSYTQEEGEELSSLIKIIRGF